MRAQSKIAALASSAALAACSVVGIRDIEEPAFTVVGRLDDIELRHYAPRIAAETAVPGDEMAARSSGFRRLAGYIFRNNATQKKIAMTAPVAQASEKIAMTAPVSTNRDASGNWSIRFFMPSHYTLQTLPVPVDRSVHLVTVPAETMAVLRFSGSIAPETIAVKQQELISRLRQSQWQPSGAVVTWFYDPPWTLPFLRRNEVAVPVTEHN